VQVSKERVELKRERVSNRKHGDCSEVRATALRLRLQYYEGFSLRPISLDRQPLQILTRTQWTHKSSLAVSQHQHEAH